MWPGYSSSEVIHKLTFSAFAYCCYCYHGKLRVEVVDSINRDLLVGELRLLTAPSFTFFSIQVANVFWQLHG